MNLRIITLILFFLTTFLVSSCGPKKINCEKCNKTGKIECPQCEGEGKEKCIYCYGKGKQNCSSCYGSGKEECGYCNGVARGIVFLALEEVMKGAMIVLVMVKSNVMIVEEYPLKISSEFSLKSLIQK
jgi:hypothetical protein